VAVESFKRRLGSTDVVVLDGGLFPQPRDLLSTLGKAKNAGKILIVLPQITAQKANRLRSALEKIPAVERVYPVDADISDMITRMQQSLPRNAKRAGSISTTPIVIGVWNGAGGVGKTTVGTNLAFAIAQKGARTFFVNLDAPDDASLMMGLKAEPNISHWRADPRPETLASLVQKLDGLDVLAGFRDVFAQSEAIETPADQPGSVRALVAQAKQRYEVIVLDTPQSPIAAHVLAAADQLVLVARSGLADAHRTAVAYRTVVDRMAEGIPEACVHVVINRLQAGHRLDAARWRKAAATTLGRPFPPVVAQIEDDVRIGDAQDKRKLPVAEISTLRENLDPLIAALVPSLVQSGNGKSIQIGPFEVVR
jgi:cellulose biosynthesis protein BcsQ